MDPDRKAPSGGTLRGLGKESSSDTRYGEIARAASLANRLQAILASRFRFRMSMDQAELWRCVVLDAVQNRRIELTDEPVESVRERL